MIIAKSFVDSINDDAFRVRVYKVSAEYDGELANVTPGDCIYKGFYCWNFDKGYTSPYDWLVLLRYLEGVIVVKFTMDYFNDEPVYDVYTV